MRLRSLIYFELSRAPAEAGVQAEAYATKDSTIRVTGPSLVRDTDMWAWKIPVSTCTLRRDMATKCSYNARACSAGAAASKLGRRPLRQSPQRVNWETTNMAPPVSRRL